MIIKSRKMSAVLTIVATLASLMGPSVKATDSNQNKFFNSVKAHCGNAFSGKVEDSSNSTAYTR